MPLTDLPGKPPKGPLPIPDRPKRAKPNTVTRPCTECGFRVRVGEGRWSGKTKGGEWTVRHVDDCPTSEPAPPAPEPVVDHPRTGVERITPEVGPRIYRIKGHGDYQSVTTVLSVLDKGGPMDMWRTLEAGHAALDTTDLRSSDYRSFKAHVRGMPDLIASEAALFGTIVHDVIEKIILARLDGTDVTIEWIAGQIDDRVPDHEHMRPNYLDRVGRYIDNFLRWERKWIVRWIGAEAVCWHTEEGWAGSADGLAVARVGVIDELDSDDWEPSSDAVVTKIDWKTSKWTDYRFRKALGRLTKTGYRLQVGGAYSRSEYMIIDDADGPVKPPKIDQAMVVHFAATGSATECISRAEFDDLGAEFRTIQEISRLTATLTGQA